MYALGYFLEVGIGTPPDPQQYVLNPLFLSKLTVATRAAAYFQKAADLGDKRAQQRLKGPPVDKQQPEGQEEKSGKDCVIM